MSLILIATASTAFVHLESATALGTVNAVSAGIYHSCAVESGGTVECWGQNGTGDLGDGTAADRSMPAPVLDPTGTSALTGATQVAAGGGVSCALMSDTTVDCWGDNGSGELGIGTTTGPQTCGIAGCSLLPVKVKDATGTTALSGVVALSVGTLYACARLSNNTAVCWGSNAWGQLANPGAGSIASLPVVVKNNAGTGALANIAQISAGGTHTCARLTGGGARCWGGNNSGELGTGNTIGHQLPVTVMDSTGVNALTGVVNIAAATHDTCAVLSDHSVRCWGQNIWGQVGDGTTTQRLLPTQVYDGTPGTPLVNASSVALGDLHACAALLDGTARCWGSNGEAQLGDGDVNMYGPQVCGSSPCALTAQPVIDSTGASPLSNVVSISAVAGYHTCATLSNHTAQCWGQNTYGELGDSTNNNRCRAEQAGVVGAPATVPPTPQNVTAVAGNAQATVSWSLPTPLDCASPLIAFDVTISPPGTTGEISAYQSGNGGWQLSDTFRLLTNGVSYSFTVAGKNTLGVGAFSPPSNSVTPMGPPDATTNVTATAGNAQATVSWTAPAANGSPITGYIITTSPGGVTTNVAPPATQAVVSSLTNGVTYSFTVAAVNGVGTGPASAASNQVVPHGTVSITSLAPPALGQGAAGYVAKIRGAGFKTGATVSYSGTGISVATTTVNSSTLITVTLNLSTTATVGPHDVTVTNTDTSSVTCVGCFTVDVGPSLTSLSPATLARGTTGAHITVTGANFSNGAFVVRAKFSGTGVTVTQVVWIDANHLKLTVDVASTAATGKRALTVINNDAGRATKQGALTIT